MLPLVGDRPHYRAKRSSDILEIAVKGALTTMQRILALPILLLALANGLLAGPALAQQKHALVVGIDTYDNLPAHAQLQKAVGDATAMNEALAGLGFNVFVEPNATRSVFNERWQHFLNLIKPGDTAAVVFSGHGVEINGANYLLPRDVPHIRPGRDELLKRESLSLAEILSDLRERRPGFSLIVLDACRDNPFAEGGKSVGGSRGLARVEPPEGTFIMFSAGANQSALDRLSAADKAPTSIYTRTLLPLLKSPGLSILDMADRVGEQVRDLAATISHRQTPAFYSGVIGGRRVCLAGCEAPGATPVISAPPPAPPAAVAAPAVPPPAKQAALSAPVASVRPCAASREPVARAACIADLVRRNDTLLLEAEMRSGLADNDPTVRGAAFRAYLASRKELSFKLSIADSEMQLLQSTKTDREQGAILRTKRYLFLLRDANFQQTFVIKSFDFASGSGELAEPRASRAPGYPFVITSDRLSFSTNRCVGNVLNCSCSFEASATRSLKLEGEARCRGFGFTPMKIRHDIF